MRHEGPRRRAERDSREARRFADLHPQWQRLNLGAAVAIFHDPPPGRSVDALVLPREQGVILGTLFPDDLNVVPGAWRAALDDGEAAKILSTGGKRLIQHYWGGYVAILNTQVGTHVVMRDPSGRIPCLVIEDEDLVVITSNLEFLAGALPTRFSMNVKYLAAFMYESELPQSETALNEVSEVRAGECLEIRAARVRRSLVWDPREISRRPAIEDFGDAVNHVRQTTQRCVDFWASRYDRIVHNLSGGLDSSAILGCLARSPYRPEVTCVHSESGGTDDQERRYAELAARRAGAELVIQSIYSSDTRYDERVFRLPRLAVPSVPGVAMTLNPEGRNRALREARAEAAWDGQGGDHLFFQTRSMYGAIDYVFRHGIGPRFYGCVADAARRSRRSYWQVLGRAIRLGLLWPGGTPEREYDRAFTFLNPEAIPRDLPAYIWVPWTNDAADIAPGKRWQISLLAFLLHRHRPIPELQFASQVHPLFSQPLVELCLRIPIDVLLRGGDDRALERAAFRDCVPEQIIRRENKATVGQGMMSKVRESMPFLRELLLDGVLVAARVLDRNALMPYLMSNRPLVERAVRPFFSCLAAEIWARKWSAGGWRLS
jgi:asparagine synthase (glutamine-hydrolysing)